jgi:hypothetical protein
MKPLIHSKNSAKIYGGVWQDYLPIHDFMDSSKSAHPTMAHRAIFHSAFGIYIVEKIFGTAITNSDGKLVSVRDIAESHVLEDLGFIPSLDNWLESIQLQDWMLGSNRKALKEKIIKID